MGNASLTIRLSIPVVEVPVATPVSTPQPPVVAEVPAPQAAPVKKNSWIKWFVLGIAIVVVAIGTFLIVSTLSSPSEKNKADLKTSMQAYSNSERQFYFTYPPDWEEMPSSVIGEDESIIIGFWASSEEYDITANVLIAIEDLPEEMDIDTYFDLTKQGFPDGPPVTISQKDITVAGIPAIRWVYKSPSVESVTQMQVSFIRDDTAWLLIFTCADKAFDKSEVYFDDMIDSFRFTDNRSDVIFSTAKLSEATMTTAVDADMRPLNATDVFTVDIPEIHCSVKLSNAPEDTEIKSEWVYLHGDMKDLRNYLIDSTVVITEGTRYLDFSLTNPENGWPIGEYEIILSIDDKEAMRVPFSVKKLNIVMCIPPAPHL